MTVLPQLSAPTVVLVGCLVGCGVQGQAVVFPGSRCPSPAPSFCTCDQQQTLCDCEGADAQFPARFSSTREVIIRSCGQVTLAASSIYGEASSGPNRLTLQDVARLELQPGALQIGGAELAVSLTNCSVPHLPPHTFAASHPNTTASLTLHIHRSQLNNIASEAFGNTTLISVTITSSVLLMVESKAVVNTVRGNVTIMNNTIAGLRQRAIVLRTRRQDKWVHVKIKNNIFVGDVSLFLAGTIWGHVYLTNNTFPPLAQSPCSLHVLGDLTLHTNHFLSLPTDGLRAKVKGRVNLTHNIFGSLAANALRMIEPDGDKSFFFLDGNVIQQHAAMSLCLNEGFTAHGVVIRHTLFTQQCDCNITQDLALALGLPQHNLTVFYQDGIHEQWYSNGECLLQPRGISQVSVAQFFAYQCLGHSHTTMILLLCFAVVLVTIAMCVILAWRRVKRRTTVEASSADYHAYTEPQPPSRAPSSWLLVQPDTRTYQETEIHVLFDNAKEMDDSPPAGQQASSGPDTADHNTADNNTADNNTADQNTANQNTADNNTASSGHNTNSPSNRLFFRVTKPGSRQSCPVLPRPPPHD